ncbi:hypothetical protein HaLaN_08514 [Haematococcus lacustris]|uniref:Uncharacterized protein n=1 Tax=Haematococcus lacustris TaxID=44745 RepID=A0A699Z0I9_HAELA|nr:hypothetical protein HaLaN_08514 [Haematococcus lacustris]
MEARIAMKGMRKARYEERAALYEELRGQAVERSPPHALFAQATPYTDHAIYDPVLKQALWAAFLAVALLRVKARSERAVVSSLLLGFLIRDLFSLHVADQLDVQGQPVYTDIPISQAAIPDLSCRNLYLHLCCSPPGDGENTRPSAAVAAVLAAHPDLRARPEATPRCHSDIPRYHSDHGSLAA